MNEKIISVNVNSDSEQVMIHWPNGSVEFHTIDTVSKLLQMVWWLVKLIARQKKDGYIVKYTLDGEEA